MSLMVIHAVAWHAQYGVFLSLLPSLTLQYLCNSVDTHTVDLNYKGSDLWYILTSCHTLDDDWVKKARIKSSVNRILNHQHNRKGSTQRVTETTLIHACVQLITAARSTVTYVCSTAWLLRCPHGTVWGRSTCPTEHSVSPVIGIGIPEKQCSDISTTPHISLSKW